MKLTRLFNDFFESEKAGGIILIFCTIFSLILANSSFYDSYLQLWQTSLSGHSFEYWINDGLMAIFFLMIGLELEREIYSGELAQWKNAMLPVLAALGGMIVPAAIHFGFNSGLATQSGAGIPMATDIAFAIGVLALLGNKVPASLKLFLIALAVIDDLGAILTIAIFYSEGLDWQNLIFALVIFSGLLIMNRLKIRNVFLYLIPGALMWYFMSLSGIHPTISGVLLAFAIPFGNGNEKSTSYILQHALHKPVAFVILPFFALSNTAIHFSGDITAGLSHPNSLGIFFGLVFGKFIGISLFVWLAIKLSVCNLPEDINMKQILSVSFLGGIGFTMSIFITLLAFNDAMIIENSKLTILISSCVAAILGSVLLKLTLKKT